MSIRTMKGEPPILTSEQCRAARALLDWGRSTLCERAEVAPGTLSDLERGKRAIRARTLRDIRAALEAAGVEFIDGERPGVRVAAQRGE